MKYRELLEGQSEESSIITMGLLQSNNETYQIVMNFIMNKVDEDVPDDFLEAIRKC